MNNRACYWLIISGLVIIPFYELLIKLLPCAVVIAPDTRICKEYVGMIFALAIFLFHVNENGLKKINNKFLCILVGFLLISLIEAPKTQMIINNVDSSGMWMWEPTFKALCYFLMFASVSSIEFSNEQIVCFMNKMVICAAIMGGYMIFQKFGFDQYFAVKPKDLIGIPTEPSVAGNLGQPTLASSFIVLMAPIALYLRKYWMLGIILLAALITKSAFSICAISIVLLIQLFFMEKKKIVLGLLMLMVVSVPIFKLDRVSDNGRFAIWMQTWVDIRTNPILDPKNMIDFSYTGVGLGSFQYYFPIKHTSQFDKPHNEYLEALYSMGIFGVSLILMFFYKVFKDCYSFIKNKRQDCDILLVLLFSFLTISLNAIGTFVWHLGAHTFYTVFILGLIYSIINKGTVDGRTSQG